MRQAILKEYWIYATYYLFFSSVKRVKWTEEEEREIKIFFKQYFGTDCKKKCPSMKDCLHAIKESKKSDGKICLRNWETLKKKSEQYV